MTVTERSEDAVVVDVVGITAPLANALRRIMLAEVPTMAVEKVLLLQNTSIIQDEVLAHRLGLIPIRADPRLFEFMGEGPNAKHTSRNTIVFTLEAHCREGDSGSVYSSALRWVPQGQQKELFAEAPIRPVHDDILIAKLRPGQIIEAELRCVKGTGQTHAKWSPVATASYRLLPEVVVEKAVRGDQARRLVELCPARVFDLEELGGKAGPGVKVARPRACTMCRECLRPSELEGQVRLQRVRDHFIFSIESTGVYRPEEIFAEALAILRAKASALLAEL